MPPVTRRSQPGAASKRSTATLPSIASSAFNVDQHPQQQVNDASGLLGSTFTERFPPLAPQNPVTSTLSGNKAASSNAMADNTILHPLREMAERVGREVETFAEELDQFLESLPLSLQPSSSLSPVAAGGGTGESAATGPMFQGEVFTASINVVKEFKRLAEDGVAALERAHRQERAALLRQEWADAARLPPSNPTSAGNNTTATSRFSFSIDSSTTAKPGTDLSPRAAEQVSALRAWQAEVDVWELMRLVLELHHNPDAAGQRDARARTAAALPPPNRYTSESELWQRFLLTDDVAHEREAVKTWLESTAEHQQSALPGIVAELEARAGRGKGLWTHGWMHTRERIKGEKRLRAGPTGGAAEDGPLLDIRRKDNNEPLAAALDPDAAARQGRVLEADDAYFERAVWVACWEMLRRGSSWEHVSQWCEERKEGWRAISMGKSAQAAQATSNATWRNMCRLASQSRCANEYEAAVYGLLGGNVKAVQKVCRSVDDHLFAHYSTALLQQFDQYLNANFPDRTNAAPPRSWMVHASEDPQQQIFDLIAKLRTQPITTTESVHPMKIIESYLLANDLDSMIYSLGHAVSFVDSLLQGDDQMIILLDKFWDHDGNLPEAEVVLDMQTLRIATHICVILRTLRTEPLEEKHQSAEENLLVAYIQLLRAAGKRDMIPLYASQLSPERWVITMSRVMQDIIDPGEVELTLKLMQTTGRNTIGALNESLRFSLTAAFGQTLPEKQPLRVLEPTEDKALYPGQRIIAGFMSGQTTESDETIVRSLQWFNMLEGHWHETFYALTQALRRCLVHDRIACAAKIVREFPYENVSIRKSFQAIGKSVNMMEHEGPAPADERQAWEVMKRQSRTYYELGLLVNALEALATWRDLEHAFTSKRPRPHAPPSELKEAKTAVDEAMQPLLAGILLQSADEEEDAELARVRTAYLPEVILAYNTVLYTAGPVITRHSLVESMDLSVAVANDANGLSACFVAAGRMRELVTSFAHTSKLMLVLKAEGRSWQPRKDREGKDLGIWEIGPQNTSSSSPVRSVGAGAGAVRELGYTSLN